MTIDDVCMQAIVDMTGRVLDAMRVSGYRVCRFTNEFNATWCRLARFN